jgi:hypothetical protein
MKVVAKVDNDMKLEADDLDLAQYEFSFDLNLPWGSHILTVEAWDYAGLYLYKEQVFEPKEGGPPLPSVPSITEWGIVAATVMLGVLTLSTLRRRVLAGKRG